MPTQEDAGGCVPNVAHPASLSCFLKPLLTLTGEQPISSTKRCTQHCAERL